MVFFKVSLFPQPLHVLYETSFNFFYYSNFSSNSRLFKVVLAKHILLLLQAELEIFGSTFFSVPEATEVKI